MPVIRSRRRAWPASSAAGRRSGWWGTESSIRRPWPRGFRVSGLTEREIQVLRLVADGHNTAEIARQLAYSERTIKNVIQDVITRFQLRNRSHAVAYAVRQGFI